MKGQIIAAGGLGLTQEPRDRWLHEYILQASGKAHPETCYLPQAGAENRERILAYYELMVALGARPSWFSLFGRVEDGWEQRLLAQDVIFVGGGNTRSMIALWREWGVDRVLQQAAQNGTILAGVSAGAICWFEQCITDSMWPLSMVQGLGWLKGSACPHYDGEAERRPAALQMVAEGRVIDGIALCDHAAGHYVDGELRQVITTKTTAKAYRLRRKHDKTLEEAIEVRYLG
jgi:peptidase E